MAITTVRYEGYPDEYEVFDGDRQIGYFEVRNNTWYYVPIGYATTKLTWAHLEQIQHALDEAAQDKLKRESTQESDT